MDHRQGRSLIRNHPRPPWWKRRPAKILGVIVAPAVAGLVGAWFLWLAGPPQLTSPAPGKPLAASSNGTGPDSGPPVITEDVKASSYDYPSIVYPEKLTLTTAQLADLAAIMSGSQVAGLKLPADGVLTNQEWTTLTVAGNSTEPVTINNITIVKHCGAPLSGGTLIYTPFGAGSFPTSPVYFDLDKPILLGQYLSKQTGLISANFFAKEVVTLKLHEPWTFAIFTTAVDHYCRFHFQLSVATAHGPVTEMIYDHGRQFSLTSLGRGSSTAKTPMSGFGKVPFASYAAVYAGSYDNSQAELRYFRVNPATYDGTGNPASFPPP